MSEPKKNPRTPAELRDLVGDALERAAAKDRAEDVLRLADAYARLAALCPKASWGEKPGPRVEPGYPVTHMQPPGVIP